MSYRFSRVLPGAWPAHTLPTSRQAPPASASETVVWLQGEIKPGMAERIVAQIEAASTSRPLQLYVDSIGGNLEGAWDIAKALAAFQGDTEATVLKAESAAVIAMATCDKVTIARDGTVLLHAAEFHGPGMRAGELGMVGDALRGSERQIADVLAHKSKTHPSTFFSYLMGRDGGNGTRLSAEDCINYGLADQIGYYGAHHYRRERA